MMTPKKVLDVPVKIIFLPLVLLSHLVGFTWGVIKSNFTYGKHSGENL